MVLALGEFWQRKIQNFPLVLQIPNWETVLRGGGGESLVLENCPGLEGFSICSNEANLGRAATRTATQLYSGA